MKKNKRNNCRFLLVSILALLLAPFTALGETEIQVGFYTPSQEEVCLGKKLQIEYYFIYGVKEWIHRHSPQPQLIPPLTPLVNGTSEITSKLGKVTPMRIIHLPVDFILGGTTEGTFSYKAQRAGYEKITVRVQIGNDVGKASFEFPVRRCNYKATWNKVTKMKFGKELCINVQSGDGEFTQNDSGNLQGQGKEYFYTSIVETGIPGVVETQPRQGEGTFTADGATSEDGQVNIDMSLQSYPVTGSRLSGHEGGAWAPGATFPPGSAKLSFPVGEGGVQKVEFKRAGTYTHDVVIIPRSE